MAQREKKMKVIEVNNLVKKYGDVVAVDDISFSIEKGSICSILGPNGSGDYYH